MCEPSFSRGNTRVFYFLFTNINLYTAKLESNHRETIESKMKNNRNKQKKLNVRMQSQSTRVRNRNEMTTEQASK